MTQSSGRVPHLPYEISPTTNRYHSYETLWKEVALDLLCRHCEPKGKTLLDFGCGRGEFLQLAKSRGFEVTGADSDPVCVQLSSRFGTCIKIPEDGDDTYLRGYKADVVSTIHSLEHVPSPINTLRTLTSMAGQYVLVAVPNLKMVHHILRRPTPGRGLPNPGHLQGWDHGHLLNLAVTNCGLDFVDWANDATVIPALGSLVERSLGTRAAIALEAKLLRRLLPSLSQSIIALFRKR